MRGLFTVALGALALGWAAPAGARILLQETFPSADAGTPISIGAAYSVPLDVPLTLTLTGAVMVGGAEFDANEYYDLCVYEGTCTEYVYQQAGILGVGQSSVTYIDNSTFSDPACKPVPSGDPYSGPSCQLLLGGYAFVRDVDVDSATPFTLTLIEVPEPTVWALLLAGFTLLGAVLRGRRTQCVAAAHSSVTSSRALSNPATPGATPTLPA